MGRGRLRRGRGRRRGGRTRPAAALFCRAESRAVRGARSSLGKTRRRPRRTLTLALVALARTLTLIRALTRALTVTLAVIEQAATEEEEAARVARELATHSAADSVAFLAHCEQMLAQKQAWGCCSSRMVSELRRKVAEERGAGQGEERGEEHNASVEPAGRA